MGGFHRLNYILDVYIYQEAIESTSLLLHLSRRRLTPFYSPADIRPAQLPTFSGSRDP